MLEFVREEDVVWEEGLHSRDPISLETYGDLLAADKSPIFCILVCGDTRHVYLAADIVEMRYSFRGFIQVHNLSNPTTRNQVEDILYFEVSANPLFRGSTAGEKSKESAVEQQDPTVRALFICGEIDLVHSAALQSKILRNLEYDMSHVGALVGGIIILAGFILLFVLLVLLLYLLLLCFS